MQKRILVLILASILCASITGCNGTYNSADSTTPEQYLADTLEKAVVGNGDYKSLWTSDVSEATKASGFLSEEDFISNMKSQFESNPNIKILSFEPTSEKELKDGIYLANTKLIYEDYDGKKYNYDYSDYVIKEDGAYKILAGGVLTSTRYQSGAAAGQFCFTDIIVGQGVDNYSIVLTATNHTDKIYLYGWVSGANLKIKTASGEYTATMPTTGTVSPGQETKCGAVFRGIDKMEPVESVTVSNLIPLDSRGLPENIGSESPLVITLTD